MEKIYVPTEELKKQELENLKNTLKNMRKIELSGKSDLTSKLVVEYINKFEEEKKSIKSANVKLILAAAISAIICVILNLVNPTTEIGIIVEVIFATLSILVAGLSLGKVIVSSLEIGEMKDYIKEATEYIKIYSPELLKEINGRQKLKK